MAHPPGFGEVIGSILGPNHFKAKDVKSCTYCCYVINSMSRGNTLVPNRCKSIPWTVRTSRQRSCNLSFISPLFVINLNFLYGFATYRMKRKPFLIVGGVKMLDIGGGFWILRDFRVLSLCVSCGPYSI